MASGEGADPAGAAELQDGDPAVFRDAAIADRETVLEFWPHPERLDRRFAAAADGSETFVVAVGSGEAGVVGAASVRWGGGCDDTARPMLYGVEVRPDLRGRGVGSALIRHVAQLVADRGFAEVSLEVEVGNAGAIRLYHRLGFVTVGPHRHVWRSGSATGSTDVLIMHGRAATVRATPLS
ncbi:GNAT family N-acetyltransferase [Actinoplanes philippinensis]|uniref:GNAT family N-acetyltransferase n=1 Tax=Actinoplanes philippinensis TaxID=35752 RepID=UPI00340E986C